LTDEARVLDTDDGERLIPWVGEADDDQLPQEFTQVSLFIDGCASIEWCYKPLGGTANERLGPVSSGPHAPC